MPEGWRKIPHLTAHISPRVDLFTSFSPLAVLRDGHERRYDCPWYGTIASSFGAPRMDLQEGGLHSTTAWVSDMPAEVSLHEVRSG